MRIVVDADSIPNRIEIEQIAKKYNVKCILIFDDTHEIKSDYSKCIIVSKGYQSADMVLANEVDNEDIVVSNDYGVGAIALSKNCQVIQSSGLIVTNDNIDSLMGIRHLHTKIRKQNKRRKGMKKRTDEEIKLFLTNLENLVVEHKNNS